MSRSASIILLTLLIAGCNDTASPDAPAAVDASAPAGNVAKARAPEPLPDVVRVRLDTEAGAIVVALDAKRAPVTAANFVEYVDKGHFDGTVFYRAAPTQGSPKTGKDARGFIQGGVRRDYRRMLPAIAHEPTTKTGLTHEEGTISMASTGPGTATGNFFITTARMPDMDARGKEPGFAAFGRVVEGMDVVRSILAAPVVPNAGRGALRGQMLAKPVRIVSAKRVA